MNETTKRVRELRRKGFTVSGIVRQTGVTADEVIAILGEPDLLAQRTRGAGGSASAPPVEARTARPRSAVKF